MHDTKFYGDQERAHTEEEREQHMLGASEQRSEVARILSAISAEYEAGQQALTGLSSGTARHDFITARMEQMGQLHHELHFIVGDSAIAMIADQLNKGSERVIPSV